MKRNQRKLCGLAIYAAVASVFAGATEARSAVIAASYANSFQVNEAGTAMNVGNSVNFRAGSATGTNLGRNPTYYFPLPTLSGIGSDPIAVASPKVVVQSYTAPTGNPITDFNADLYVIGTTVSGSSNRILRYVESDTDANPASVKLQDNLLTPALIGTNTNVPVTADTVASNSLAAYLNSFYTNNPAYDAAVQQRYVLLRLNPDADANNPTTNNNGYLVYTSSPTNDPSFHPTLTLLRQSEVVVPTVPGDFNGDQAVNALDIDLLFAATQGTIPPASSTFDVNGDGVVNSTPNTTSSDADHWVQVLKSTRYGDTNLDQKVNFADLVALAQHYRNPTGTWDEGDMDGTDGVTFSDLVLLAQNYGYGVNPTSLTEVFEGDAAFAADWQLAQSLVPEPSAAAATISLFGVGLSRRRRLGRMAP